MKIHGGEKSHKWNQCKYTTYFQTDLKRHQKNHGMEKSCKCKQCDYAFKLLSTLKAHKKTHIGLRSHKCSQCENASAQANNLQTHIKAHSGKGLTNAINVNIPLIIKEIYEDTWTDIIDSEKSKFRMCWPPSHPLKSDLEGVKTQNKLTGAGVKFMICKNSIPVTKHF